MRKSTTASEADHGKSTTNPARRMLFLLAVLALVPYGNALRADFVYDDVSLFLLHPQVQGAFDPWGLATARYWAGQAMWRPLPTLTFGIDHLIAGNVPFLPHLVNCLLHVCVTLALAGILLTITGRRTLAFVAGALFAVHPIHTEAVTWISGRAELLAALLSLLALLLATNASVRHSRGRQAAILTTAFLAICSKESAVTLAPLLLYFAWAMPARRASLLRAAALALVAFLVYLPLRWLVLGTLGAPSINPLDNPLVGLGLFSRFPTALDAAGRYLLLFLWPARLSLDYSPPVLTIVRALTPQLLLGLAAAGGLGLLAVRYRERPEGWGAAMTLLTFAMASNIIVAIPTIFGERLFYLPSAGLTIVVAAAALRVVERRPRTRHAGLALLAVVLCAGTLRTWARNSEFRSDSVLYPAEVRAQPRSARMRLNYALQLNLEKRYEEALAQGREALRLNPASRDSRNAITTSLVELGRTNEAIAFLQSQLAVDPLDAVSRSRLVGLLDVQDPGRADSIAQAAIADPALRTPELLAIAAKRAQDRGEFARAGVLWQLLMAAAPRSVDSALYLGYCMLRLNRPADAKTAYEEALRRAPGNPEASNGIAWCLLEIGGSADEAARYAADAVRSSPGSSYMHDTLARALLAAGRCADARAAAERGIALDPASESLRQRLRAIEAECD